MPFAAVGPRDLHYEVTGDGPPLVLVMGLGVGGEAWRPLLPLFAGYRTLTYDNAGVGLTRDRATGAPPEPPYATEGFADDLAGLLRRWSWAGARRRRLDGRRDCNAPRRTRALARADPDALRDLAEGGRPPPAGLRLPRGPARAARPGGPPPVRLALRLGPARVGGRRRRASPPPRRSSAPALPPGTTRSAGGTSATCAPRSSTTPPASSGRSRRRRSCSSARASILTPARFARSMAEAIPAATLELAPDRGHAFPFEAPEEFARRVRAFLERTG